MERRPIRTAAMLIVALAVVATATAQEANVPVEEFTLDNGMHFLMVERHESPTVSAGWVTHAGSANETYGITGIAHLFEHMMFKGSTTIGTKDYAKEQTILDQLDQVREQMEVEYSNLRAAKRRGEIEGSIYLPENQTPRLAELRDQMKALQEQHRQLIVKDEFDQIYTELGASGMNAFTNNDITTYFITVPANKLELWFWMESERLLNPVLREFYSERDVVREERRLRTESDPTARFEEQFDAMFWAGTPYQHPVVGWPSDVESINREQAEKFFATYYAPNNLTAALVGDFDHDQAVALAKKYFGRLQRGPKVPEVVTEPTEQLEKRMMVAYADTNPSVQIRWPTVPFMHKDSYALDVLSSILSGRTGRLYKSLVEDSHLASGEPYAYQRSMKYAGAFEVGAELAENASHDQVEAALVAEIDKLKHEAVPDHELQKVKNQNLANSFRRLQSNFFLLLQLLIYDGLGDWHYLNESSAMIQAVTPEDVMAVANSYFAEDKENVLWYFRKEGSEEDPALAGLTGQAKQMAKQMLSRVAQVDDPDQLRAVLGQLQAGIGQAPPDVKPALEVVITKVQERLATLEGAAGEEE